MPRKPMKSKHRRQGGLTGAQRYYLCCGWCLEHNQNMPMPRAAELWRQHQAELLAYWTQAPDDWEIPEGGSPWHWPKPGGPGSLPWAEQVTSRERAPAL